MRKLFHRLGNFRRNTDAVVLVLFVVILLPLTLVVAVAIDYSQFLTMKQRLGTSLDAAALDLANSPGLTEEEARVRVEAIMRANFPDTALGNVTIETVRPLGSDDGDETNDDTVRITASVTTNTALMRLGGINTMTTRLASEAIRRESRVEVVMVLDNTGSMLARVGGRRKIDSLKTAATRLTEILFSQPNAAEFVRIGLVPFTGAVNVGVANRDAPWLDAANATARHGENLDLVGGETIFSVFDRMTRGWGGCVRARPAPYDTLDTPPDPSVPDTMFVPYFAPDEPGGSRGSCGHLNSYLDDVPAQTSNCGALSETERRTLQRRTAGKYANADFAMGSGPNLNCVIQPILELTNDQRAVLDAISAMTARGNTVIPAGLAWGWHVISPAPPFTSGGRYNDPQLIKAIILLTDGDNDISGGYNSFNKSTFNAYGYANEPGAQHLGTNFDLRGPELALDDKVTELCNNIKADLDGDGQRNDILIYTIIFGLSPGSRVETIFRNCATDTGKFFNSPTDSDLNRAFEAIAVGLNQLRLAK